MAKNINTIQGTPQAIGKRLLVTEMDFGEQVTESGLIIAGDDGKTRGIYPRWGKVYSTGPRNVDAYEEGQWVLVEHGRWTRALTVQTPEGEITFHMIDEEGVLGYADEKPGGLRIGAEYTDGPATIDPGSFITQ